MDGVKGFPPLQTLLAGVCAQKELEDTQSLLSQSCEHAQLPSDGEEPSDRPQLRGSLQRHSAALPRTRHETRSEAESLAAGAVPGPGSGKGC